MLLTFMLVISPYYGWIFSTNQPLPSSRLLYYPIAVNGYVSAFEDTPAQLWSTFNNTTLSQILLPRLTNIALTFTPIILLPFASQYTTHNYIFYYTHDYPGALSTLMYIVILLLFLKRLSTINTTLLTFLAIPWLIVTALYAWQEWGLLTGILHPTIPLLVILGINELHTHPRLTKVVFAAAIIENLIFLSLMRNFALIEGGLPQITKTGEALVPGFQIQNFISLYYVLTPTVQLALLLITVILVYKVIQCQNVKVAEKNMTEKKS